jgi:hypothetical protein
MTTVACLWSLALAASLGENATAIAFGAQELGSVALAPDSPVGEASIREHAVAWHPAKLKYYLVADVIRLNSPHHPNTYDTELHLWASEDLVSWTYIGLAVPKGTPDESYDGYGVASPAGMALVGERLYVPFSARRTAAFTERAIGLAWSGSDPEVVPWTKSAAPVSKCRGEDDDPAVLLIPGDDRLHLYHRTTGEGGYRIVHTASATPQDPGSWPKATDVTRRPAGVRAQELTGAVFLGGAVHLFVIEQGDGVKGVQIAHLSSPEPDEYFQAAQPRARYLQGQPRTTAFGGHFTPVMKDGKLAAASWTVRQGARRYGLGLRAAHWARDD